MNSNPLTKTFNYFLIALCLLAILKSYHELYIKKLDLTLSSNSPMIGEVEEFNNTVKIKKENLFNWIDGNNQSKLNKNDLVYTHKDSRAKLKIGDQQIIEVFEQSMIEIEDQQTLHVTSGKLSLKFKDKKTKMAIRIGAKKFTVESKNANVIIENSLNKNKIKVEDGQIKITEMSTTKQITLDKDQSLDVKQDQLQVQTEAIEWISPLENEIKIQHLKKDVIFEIKSKITKPHLLRLATDENFKNIIREINIKEKISLELSAGQYFYQINADGLMSDTKTLKIISTLPALIKKIPIENTAVQVYQLPTEIEFSFIGLLGIDEYIIDLVNLQNQEKQQVILKDTKAKIKIFSEGEYQWNVVANNSWIEHFPIEYDRFKIEKLQYKAEAPLVIELKRPNQKVTFEWQAKGKSTFILSRDEKFNDVILEKKLNDNKIDFSFPETGVFYWKSVQKDENGNLIPSKPIQVLIRPTPEPEKPKELPQLEIKLKSTFNFFKKILNELFFNSAHADDKVPIAELTWPVVEEAKLYEIEIYEDESLKKLILKFVSKDNVHNWKTNLSGVFYWRMRYQDYWNRYSPFSNASALKIIPNEKKTNPEHLPTIAKENQIQKVLPKIEYKKPKLLISYAPTVFNIESKYIENKFTIDGIALNSWQLDQHHQLLDSKSFFRFNFSQGKIFNSENFIFAKMDNPIEWNWLTQKVNSNINFYWSPQIHILQEYEYQTAVQVNQYATPLSIMAGAKYDWQKSHLALSSEFSIGQIMKLALCLTYEYLTNSEFSYLFGLSMQNMTYNSNNYEHKINQIQVFISRPI